MRLFAGIIVDDTIVVGEEILSQLQAKLNASSIARGIKNAASSLRLFSPTMRRFPLMLIGGIGQILFAIPLVVICIILASLLECFVYYLHLYHSYGQTHHRNHHQTAPLHEWFIRFREGPFKKLAKCALTHRAHTLSLAFAIFLLSSGLVISGKIPFNFFPSPDGTQVEASATFIAGTPQSVLNDYRQQLEKSLLKTNQILAKDNHNQPMTTVHISYLNQQGLGVQRKTIMLLA